ncbi:MAG: RNA polymerase sigma factor, partial [Bauldia sp.]|nr:RNA polymerase sigma factor [Bauldia sp.]
MPMLQQTLPSQGFRSEATLVDRARGRDPAAIREIIRINNRRLFRVARAVLGDDAEAEDVVQETYVRAFSQLATFRGDAAIGTWLTRIALNEALGRKRRIRPVIDIEDLDDMPSDDGAAILPFPGSAPGSTPEAALGRSEVRDLLQHAIDGLPAGFRLVFVLRDVEGLDIEETANQLGIRPETVKTRLFRARRLLRTALESRLAAG